MTPLTIGELLETIVLNTKNKTTLIVGAHNLHSVYLCHTNADFSVFYDRCNVTVIDGMPILLACNLNRRTASTSPLTSNLRFGSTDWIFQAIDLYQVQRICVIGANAISNHDFLEKIKKNNSSIKTLGIPADPWNENMIDDLCKRIKDFAPDLTLVGMGMPLQERITLKLVDEGVKGTIATVGGAIDQLSGHQSLAPRWLGKLGIEWLWRLTRHPTRLAERYLVEPWKLLYVLTKRRR